MLYIIAILTLIPINTFNYRFPTKLFHLLVFLNPNHVFYHHFAKRLSEHFQTLILIFLLKLKNWKFFNKESFLALFKYFDFGGFNSVDELLSYFNNFIIAVLDIVLPLKLFSFRLLSKRYSCFDMDCISFKRIARKYERNYKTNKSTISFYNYKSALHTYKSTLFSKHCYYLINSIDHWFPTGGSRSKKGSP